MILWIDAHNDAPYNWLTTWTTVKTIDDAIDIIHKNKHLPSCVTLVNIDTALADNFLLLLAEEDVVIEVKFHGATPSTYARAMVAHHHWDKKVMDKRTAELIMVLKGNHDLDTPEVEGRDKLSAYVKDVALYMSDLCDCPFDFYEDHPHCLEGEIQRAVCDYAKACYNPSELLFEYFEYKRTLGHVYNDMQLWCAALAATQVRDNGKFVNGFSEYLTQAYKRQRPFYLHANT